MHGPLFPIWIFITSSISAALAGIASYLQSGKPVTKLALITAALNSGLLGFAISAFLYHNYEDNPFRLIGMCVIAGLAGAAGFDIALSLLQKGVISINLHPESKKNDETTKTSG